GAVPRVRSGPAHPVGVPVALAALVHVEAAEDDHLALGPGRALAHPEVAADEHVDPVVLDRDGVAPLLRGVVGAGLGPARGPVAPGLRRSGSRAQPRQRERPGGPVHGQRTGPPPRPAPCEPTLRFHTESITSVTLRNRLRSANAR